MDFFNSAVGVLQTLVIALGAGLGIWGAINLMEGYGNDNPGAKSQGMKQLMAGGGVALIGGTAENACPDADRESRPETTSTMRTRGYVLAHEERGLQVDWRLVRNADWVQSGGRDAVAGLLDDPDAPRPDAVMCLNDALAIGVIHELQRRGVRVPQDMQVIGFDNVPDAEYCMPGLTTIDPHVDDYARHAVDMLIARIEGSADPFRTYVTSYDLVRRASTC